MNPSLPQPSFSGLCCIPFCLILTLSWFLLFRAGITPSWSPPGSFSRRRRAADRCCPCLGLPVNADRRGSLLVSLRPLPSLVPYNSPANSPISSSFHRCALWMAVEPPFWSSSEIVERCLTFAVVPSCSCASEFGEWSLISCVPTRSLRTTRKHPLSIRFIKGLDTFISCQSKYRHFYESCLRRL